MATTRTGYDRAREWLDMLGKCSNRLRLVDAKILEMEIATDDLRPQRFDMPNVKESKPRSDRISEILGAREAAMSKLRDERDLLAIATSNAKRLIAEVAEVDGSTAVKKGLVFAWARHIRGMKASKAARSMGLPRSTAYLYEKRFIQALVDHAPDKFNEEHPPYGWLDFARRELERG